MKVQIINKFMQNKLKSGSLTLLLPFIIFLNLVSCKPSQVASDQLISSDTVQIAQEPQVAAVPPEPEIEVDRGPYRAENTRFHDLVHTRLEVSFDWDRQYLLGTALLELRPYFYAQDHVILDAKGFDIHQIQLVNGTDRKPLTHQYDGKKLNISLDRSYQRNESYFLEIKYTAKPNELEAGGSAAITSDKGLYFINPTGEHTNKPQQIWTQGETEASSCWFPTIDSPNQRTTQEIYITVDQRFVTLSNGLLVFSRGNEDGTRTDYWKMDQAHAPYLFMMAVGEFAVVKDSWQDMEVSYYVEPEYQPYARAIFGKTPQMLTYFSELLKYPFPWSKYSQVVVRDYVSGAMENTTASVFMEDLQVNHRYLLDNDWDGIIAHELFHQWFGDLVTNESWSNLTLNEAFATYSEYLWAEHLLGQDDADYKGYEEQQNYLREARQKKVDLIRFYYDDKEDMFDSHSYAKGSRILHMLRGYLGDEAFFETLHQYLSTYAGEPVEVHHLRLAAEKVSGQDLNWFFNQWFLNSGHPELQVSTEFSDDALTLSLFQIQDRSSAPLYRLPIEVEFWHHQEKTVETIELSKEAQDFNFPMTTAPDLVVIDPRNVLLAEIHYEQSRQALIHQYRVSSGGMTRYKALEKLLEDSVDSQIVAVFMDALEDSFWVNRQLTVNAFESYPEEQPESLVTKLRTIAASDPNTQVRADAITVLSSFENGDIYLPLYLEALRDSSYAVAGAGLTAYLQTEHPDRDQIAGQFEQEDNMQIALPVADYYALNHVPDKYRWYYEKLSNGNGEMMFYMINYFGQYLTNSDQEEQLSGAKYLEELGLHHHTYYIRYSAFQALGLLTGIEEAAEMRSRVKQSETDPRLVEIYAQYP
ncbi:MAG: aminopeptidase [Cyclobacteriaceae bacterium]|nr:MAG: aminopeptidase [Cyclobacteriaceae bacterium]